MSGSKRPPRNSSPTLLPTGGQKSSKSTSAGSKSSSNTPSGSANNENGQSQLHKLRCSVLCHPLGLPLLSAFHGKDPGELPHLRQESSFYSTGKDSNLYGDVLQSAVDEWRKEGKLEIKLTKILNNLIDGNYEIPLKAKAEYLMGDPKKSHGKVDIALESTSSNGPLMFLEVGLKGDDWWKKFDQAVKYVKMKYAEEVAEPFTGPLLLAVMTIDDANESKPGDEEILVKLAVFLCTRKKMNEQKENFRISLLWHSKMRKLKAVSEAFGCLLRRVCDFTSWLAKLHDERNTLKYEYFSSNCCRVDENYVLRSYDSRFHQTTRSPEIYLSDKCKAIVGDVAKEILNCQGIFVASPGDKDDEFWTARRSLQVIVTPYRPGTHVAKKPTSFLPIIDDLKSLHDEGFVHGDIRGFNAVFDENSGCLIDFDFGGKAEKAKYPRGYREALLDGKRLMDASGIIQKWHDWYALGRLIFEVHTILPPDEAPGEDWKKLKKLDRAWDSRKDCPSPEMIDELKSFLAEIEEKNWILQPSPAFGHELEQIYGGESTGMEETNPRATGSPPKG